VAGVVFGAVLVAGIASLVVAWFSHSHRPPVDPLEEADRRIDELEHSLRRMQETFGEVISV